MTKFDPESYEPLADDDPMRLIRQRINQTNSQAGLPAVLDWSPEDLESQLLAHSRFAQERNRDKRRWGAALVEEHLRWRDPHDDMSAVRGPAALFAFDTRIPFSLAEHNTEDLIAKYLSDRYITCDVQAHSLCETHGATTVLQVGYGEWLCLGKCCTVCQSWFDDPNENGWTNPCFPSLGDPLSDRHVAT